MQAQKLFALTALALVIAASPSGSAQAADAAQGSPAMQCPAASKWVDAYVKRMRAEAAAYASAKPKDPILARDLARRAALDQEARGAVMAASSKPSKADYEHLQKVDRSNLKWIKQQVNMRGFPSAAEVGAKGVQNAWLLAQHADSDSAFQAKVLSQIKLHLKHEGFMRADYAMLTDRVRLAQHRKQLYGSQLAAKNGQWVLRPVENRAHLDERRADMELMPMADYMCWIRASYGAAPKKS